MKNKLTAILALLLAAIMLAGCTAHVENQDSDKDNENIDISVKVTPTAEPTVEPTVAVKSVKPFSELKKEFASEEDAYAQLYNPQNNYWKTIDGKVDYEIPIYKYDEILFLDYAEKMVSDNDRRAWDGAWDNFAVKLTTDHSYVQSNPNIQLWELCMLAMFLQGGALRENPKYTSNAYMMYDTDKGHRIYFFFEKVHEVGRWIRSGTAAIMLEKVSFEAYKPLLKEGVDVDTLVQADPAMKAWSDHLCGPILGYITSEGKGDPYRWQTYSKGIGQRLTSAVILTDGMLFITWDYVDGKFVVDTYEYREDFIYDAYGIQVCYKINEEDYVG